MRQTSESVDALSANRVAVIQNGQMVGTLPSDFAPSSPGGGSLLRDLRPDDLRREGDGWIADRTVDRLDLLSIQGFVPA